MKQILGNKLYDTDTATEICCASSCNNSSDFDFSSKSLHKTRKGKYFVHHHVSIREASTGDTANLEAIDDAIAAKEWAVEHCPDSADEIVAEFGCDVA